MQRRHAEGWSRREFLGLTLAGTAGLLGLKPEPVVAEPPLETTTLRLLQFPTSICQAPHYMAEKLLHAEGFTEVQYVKTEGGVLAQNLARGEVDIGMNFVGPNIIQIEAGDPIVFLAGGHIGCFELFGSEQVRNIRDLKGKTVAVAWLGAVEYVFLAIMVAYVGMDPQKDINWVIHRPDESIGLLAEGKIDAFLAFPPAPQELRAKKIGHVVVNSTLDRPWSQYFCCMVAGNREFVRKYPVATKRALRAILKATNICALQPDHAAHFLVDKGFTQHYDYALQSLKEIPYGQWAEYDSEDTVRFYALRLHEAGMIKSSPQKIIAEGTDWRFLNELKKELKG
jgi:NitT/TauT family transport system substrate-binding protein